MSNLVEDNMRLVYYIISRNYPTFLHDEDVIQSGMLGLCQAADSYDPTKGRFSTYAGLCIKNEIGKEFARRRNKNKNVSLEALNVENSSLTDDDDSAFMFDTDFAAFYESLSPTDKKLLDLLKRGMNCVKIAELWGVSPTTVTKQKRRIFKKWRER